MFGKTIGGFTPSTNNEQLEQIAQKVDQIESDVDIIRGTSKPIYGLMYNKTTQAVTRTGSAVGKNTFVSINGSAGVNDFDKEPLFAKMVTVYDGNMPMLANKFTKIPRVWIKVTDTPEFLHKQVSEFYFEGAFLAPIFWDFDKKQFLEYYLHGSYKGTVVDNILRSIPNTYPTTNINIVQSRTFAVANGTGYQQLDVHAHFVLSTLMEIELGAFNAQNLIQGFSTGQYNGAHTVTIAQTASNNIIVANTTAAQFRVGQGVGLGTSLGGNQIFYGRTITAITSHDTGNTRIVVDGAPFDTIIGNIVYNVAYRNGFGDALTSSIAILSANDGKTPFVYRGIESPFADVWQFVDGVNINYWQTWVCDDARNYASNVFASPYKALSYINGNVNGYISSLGFDANNPTVLMPTVATGSSNNWIGDYYFQSDGQRIARVGGVWIYGLNCGLSCWSLNSSSAVADVTICARLLKKPLL